MSQLVVTLGTDYCERLRHLYWLRYCNRVGKVGNCGHPWNLIRETYVSYWSKLKREVREE